MTLAQWRAMRRPVSEWRARSRSVMLDVVDAIAIMAPEMLGVPSEVLCRVDAAYPFGERKYAPYKAWLTERRLFIAALKDDTTLPTRDEAEVCAVARDLVEDGRVEQAKKLLDEHAPHRLARRCPACGRPPGKECHAMTPGQYRIVPHEARLTGHLDAGPLFGAQRP